MARLWWRLLGSRAVVADGVIEGKLSKLRSESLVLDRGPDAAIMLVVVVLMRMTVARASGGAALTRGTLHVDYVLPHFLSYRGRFSMSNSVKSTGE